jgi:hypothetical protein
MKNQQRRKVRFLGKVQEMAQEVVLSHVGQDKLEVVRARDDHPMFIGLKVAVEGFSNGEMGAMGSNLKRWPGHTIEQLGWSLNWGDISLYDQHLSKEVQEADREPVGAVLSGFSQGPEGERYSEEGLEAFAVGYIDKGEPREKINKREWDSCSIEAECVFLQDKNGDWVVEDVQEVTGIALVNSSTQQPGFPGASVVAIIQELEKEEEETVEPTEKEIQEAVSKMSSDAIRTLISGTSLQPSQLFTQDQLQADTGVQQIGSKTAADLATVRQELTTVKGENITLKASAAKGDVAGFVAIKVKGLKGLEDGERTLISEVLLEQDFSSAEDLEKAVGSAVDTQVQRINKLRADYGKEEIGSAPAEEEDAAGDKDKGDKGPDLKVDSEDPFLAANKATTDGQLVGV